MEAGEDRSFADLLADFRRDPLSLAGRLPGLWPVDKPPGPSSNHIVLQARRALGIKKLGHAGTLDPMAGGLLILMAGAATRLFDFLQEFPKTYRAGFRLGEKTDSQDATGAPLPDWRPARPPPLPAEELEAALVAFRGRILQIPPMYSALKSNGRPLYLLARRGETVERAPRPATVYRLAASAFDGVSGILELTASKGFYVRTLIGDIGDALGCGAVMTSLVRTRIGPFRLEDAREIASLAAPRSRRSG
ncbi:MAG: tRNA pseudouridine(55) synthase TruB [Planctomycetota bacterium]|jgi:tRNA pseudouridine55 synthase|nr:tRNA pseudouridine(55) synthase TruB [Planctomycetota bacterium]